MFDKRLDELDADETLTRVSALRAAAERADLGILQAAAHWADLHGVAAPAPDGPVLRGMERPVRLGGEGTPEVAEFAPAELGAELGVSPYAATVLIGDALDLRPRLDHPARRRTHRQRDRAAAGVVDPDHASANSESLRRAVGEQPLPSRRPGRPARLVVSRTGGPTVRRRRAATGR